MSPFLLAPGALHSMCLPVVLNTGVSHYLPYSLSDCVSESLNLQVLRSRCSGGCGLQSNQQGLDSGSEILELTLLKVGLVMIRLEIAIYDSCHLLSHVTYYGDV